MNYLSAVGLSTEYVTIIISIKSNFGFASSNSLTI